MQDENVKAYFDNTRTKDFEDSQKAYARITKAMEEFTIKLFEDYDDEIVSHVACSMGYDRVKVLPGKVQSRISNGAWKAIYEYEQHCKENPYVKCPGFGFECLVRQQQKR